MGRVVCSMQEVERGLLWAVKSVELLESTLSVAVSDV